jgi:hypothetical protein
VARRREDYAERGGGGGGEFSYKRLAIGISFPAGLGLENPNSGLDPGETFFPNSVSDLDSAETFQISGNLGLVIDENVCLLDSQPCSPPYPRMQKNLSTFQYKLSVPRNIYV